MKRVRLGDKVRVISGKYKGVDGAIIEINRDKNTVVVENTNIHKKHIKRDQKNQESKIIQINLPMHISNVAILDEKNHNMPTKIHYLVNKDGKKVRTARKSGNQITFKTK